MYKLIALDMDGTLLNTEHKISRENLEAIIEAMSIGVKVVLATGRVFTGISPFLKQLNLIDDNNYSVTCAGALVTNNTMSEIIKTNTLSIDDLRYIYDLAKNLNLSLNLYTRESILAFQDDVFSRLESITNKVPLKLIDINSLDDDIEIYKVTLINDSINGLMRIKKFFKDLRAQNIELEKIYPKGFKILEDDVLDKISSELSDKYTVVKPFEFTMEVINNECNKWIGIKAIAEKLGIKEEEIICVGDSENDEHMIKNAGLGVAMGNSFSKIKEVADYITYTNDNNGVAHVINKFILGKDLAYAE